MRRQSMWYEHCTYCAASLTLSCILTSRAQSAFYRRLVHGLAVDGTAQTTDDKETISNLTLCAGGMRSSFDLAVKKLTQDGTDASGLGLQIGFEYGPMNVTRLGMKGELVRCSVSRGVLAAEKEQGRCRG